MAEPRWALRANGPALMLGASLSFALMGLCVKFVATPPRGEFAAIPVGEIVLWRSGIATLIALAVGWPQRRRLAGVAKRMLVTRSLVGLASMYAYFFAISVLKLGDAVLLTYLSPLLVACLAPFVLGEKAPWTVWLALAVGFAGVWVVEQGATAGGGSGELVGIGVLAGLASAFLAASAYVSVKLLSRTDSAFTIVLWFSAIATVVSGVQVAVQGVWVTPSPRAIVALAGVGIFATVAQLMMTRAYSVSAAARVSVFGYATPVIAYVLGQVILAEAIGWRGALGCALLVLAGALATFLSAEAPRPAATS